MLCVLVIDISESHFFCLTVSHFFFLLNSPLAPRCFWLQPCSSSRHVEVFKRQHRDNVSPCQIWLQLWSSSFLPRLPPPRRAPLNKKTNICWTVGSLFAHVEFVQARRAWRAMSLFCGHEEYHRNNILYDLKYGRGANCEWSYYMKTAGRKCFATAENLQVQSNHQTVTLHLACGLWSVDGYLPTVRRDTLSNIHLFPLTHFFPPL